MISVGNVATNITIILNLEETLGNSHEYSIWSFKEYHIILLLHPNKFWKELYIAKIL